MAEEIIPTAQVFNNEKTRVSQHRHLVVNCETICNDAYINFELDATLVE